MAKSKNPQTHTVTITVDVNGHFTYVNPLIWVDRGDTIVWECTNKYRFAVHVGWDSPLDKGRYHTPEKEKIVATVPTDARPGYYRYTVAVCDGTNIWTDDPELIVKRP